jgi:hypothetical protein
MQNKVQYKSGIFFWGVFFSLVALPMTVIASESVVINEIFPNPNGSDKGREFVELYNVSKDEVNLEGWILRKTSKKGSIKEYVFDKEDKIKKEAYFKIKFSGLNNDGANIEFLSNSGEIVDDKNYEKVVEGKSYNRDEENKDNKWYWESETGGHKNKNNPKDKEYPKIIINEILPNPKGEEKKDEFIELYNPNKEDVDLDGWQIRDGSKTGKYIFKKGSKISAGEYFVIYRKDFKFALNNSGGESVKLITPNGKNVSTVEYVKARESISYNYHLKKGSWRWSKILTPKTKNVFNNLPTFSLKKPRKVYKNTYADFVLHKMRDKDGDKIKIVWDFGDGHKSYLKEARHKYKKTGKYSVKLVVDDGVEEVVKVFKIKAEKYPRYKLKIVGIMPNPDGKDKGNEIILIKNLERKRINLKNYKMGTGKNKDKILKHPFYEVIKIKAGKIKKIRNDDNCKFSLLNKGGVVQIVYPDGKIADTVKYKKKTIFPNEMYKLDEESGQWYWQGVPSVAKYNQSESEEIEVLGARTVNIIDVTLDKELEVCKTTEQIKKDNWINKSINRWLF